MKVCMVAPFFPPVFSGAGQFVNDIGRQLVGQGVGVRIVALDTGGLPKEEWKDGMHIERFRLQKTGRFGQLLCIIKLAWVLWRRRREYQVLHIHGAYLPLFGVLPLIRLLGKKTVITFHDPVGDLPESIPLRKFGSLQVKILSRVDRFVHCTSFVADSFRKTGLPMEKLRRIPSGIDMEHRFLPLDRAARSALRREKGLEAETKIVVFAGSIIPRKGVDVLVEAWHEVAASCPRARLLLLGPLGLVGMSLSHGNYVEELKNRIASLGLQDSVQLMGQTDEVEQYLQLADVFVFPSRKETFGLAVVEAMACGLPCVAATIESVTTDIIDHAVDGLLVEQENPAAMAGAVLQLLKDQATAENLGRRAAEKVRQHFSIAEIARQHRDLYQDLLS